jgi:transposase-like protein
VIALSPKTLLATNRFVCEVCNKGFQREQNLQLHRRGHNLPWKLKQKNPAQAQRRRVYLCPEPTCVHHDPARALGDLTGIKKHFCRKHGEKKWKCDKCSKRYAVQSDWKAHSKICGTLFSRYPISLSFMLHCKCSIYIHCRRQCASPYIGFRMASDRFIRSPACWMCSVSGVK